MPTYLFTAKPGSKSEYKTALIRFPAGVEVDQATQYANQHCKGDYERQRVAPDSAAPEILCSEPSDEKRATDLSGVLDDGDNDDFTAPQPEVLQ